MTDRSVNAISQRFQVFSAAVFLPSIAVLSLHAFLGSQTRLIADDFCSVHFAQRLGLLRSIWYWYINWSGRYTAFGADWLMGKIGVHALPVMPALVLLTWLLLTALALHAALRRRLPEGTLGIASLTLGSVFLFVVLLLSPLVVQSLYWWNAMRSYSLPLVLLSAYALLFQIGVQRLKTGTEIVVGGLLGFLFLFINGGLGETHVVFQCMLLAAFLVLEWFVHRNTASVRFRLLLAGLLGSIAALIIVALAPGNTVRQNMFPTNPQLATLFQVVIQSYSEFILDILRSPAKSAGLLGGLLTAFWIGLHSEQNARKNRGLIPTIFLGAIAISIACLIPGIYATSEPSPPRTMIIPVFILAAGVFSASFMLGQLLPGFGPTHTRVGKSVALPAVLLIVYAALLNGQSLYGSRNIFMDFAQRWDVADTQILQAKARGDEAVTISALNVPTGPGGDPTDNPKYWVNQCYSLYYGIQVLGPDPSAQEP